MALSEEPVYEAEVVSIARSCSAGHEVGDKFLVNTHKTSGICEYCYHDLFPTLMNICNGNQIPWMDNEEFKYDGPDRYNLVTTKVRRKK